MPKKPPPTVPITPRPIAEYAGSPEELDAIVKKLNEMIDAQKKKGK
jgi:hypothetical protein